MFYVLPPPIHPANAIRGSHLLMEVQHHTALLGWVGVGVLWMAHRVQQPGRQVRRLVEGPWRGIRGMVPRPLFQPRPPWRLLAEGWVALRGSRVAVVLIVVAWQWAVVGVQVVGVMVVMMGVGVVVVVMIVVVAVVVVVVVVVVGVVVVVVMAGQAVSPATLASHWRAAVKKRRGGGAQEPCCHLYHRYRAESYVRLQLCVLLLLTVFTMLCSFRAGERAPPARSEPLCSAAPVTERNSRAIESK